MCVNSPEEVAMGVRATSGETTACIGSVEHILSALLVDDAVLQQTCGQIMYRHTQTLCHLRHRQAVHLVEHLVHIVSFRLQVGNQLLLLLDALLHDLHGAAHNLKV